MEFLLILGAVLGLGLAYFLKIAGVGAAYKAKVLGSAIFVSRRDMDCDLAEDVAADSYFILRLFGARVDWGAQAVKVSFLGFKTQTAVYRPGLGATLSFGVKLSPGPGEAAPGPKHIWPVNETSPKLEAIVDAAFVESNPRRLKRTRALVIIQDGRIRAERYAPGFTQDMPLPGWSMAKSVTSALVGVLVGKGKLALASQALLSEWSAPGDPRANITLEDLLRMRSGLEFSEKYSDLLSDVTQMLFARPDAAAFAAAKPLLRAPGSSWSYASATTNILSLIIRRAVGEKDYSQFPRCALFNPLGMSSAVFEPDASGTFVGSSFLLAATRDWARFGQLYLQDGVWEGRRILPEGWVKFSTTATPQSPQGRYGAHWWRKLQKELGGETELAAGLPADAFYALGHEGQTLTVIPSRRLVVVRLGLSIHIEAWNHAAFVAEVIKAL